jgi:hypothetical protein
MLATTADESRPPLKKAATGTSLTRCADTDASSHSRVRASGSLGVVRAAWGNCQ